MSTIKEKLAGTVPVKLFVIVVILVTIGSVSGMAAIMQTTTVTQKLSNVGVTIVTPGNFPTSPDISASSIPLTGASKTPSGSNISITSTAVSYTAYMSAQGASGPVTAGDWAEQFVFKAPSTGVSAASDNFTLFVQYTNATLTSFGPADYSITFTFAADTAFTTLTIYVDFGTVAPPNNISLLTLTVSQKG